MFLSLLTLKLHRIKEQMRLLPLIGYSQFKNVLFEENNQELYFIRIYNAMQQGWSSGRMGPRLHGLLEIDGLIVLPVKA